MKVLFGILRGWFASCEKFVACRACNGRGRMAITAWSTHTIDCGLCDGAGMIDARSASMV